VSAGRPSRIGSFRSTRCEHEDRWQRSLRNDGGYRRGQAGEQGAGGIVTSRRLVWKKGPEGGGEEKESRTPARVLNAAMQREGDRLEELDQLALALDGKDVPGPRIADEPEAALGRLPERAVEEVMDGDKASVLGKENERAAADDGGRCARLPGDVGLQSRQGGSASPATEEGSGRSARATHPALCDGPAPVDPAAARLEDADGCLIVEPVHQQRLKASDPRAERREDGLELGRLGVRWHVGRASGQAAAVRGTKDVGQPRLTSGRGAARRGRRTGAGPRR